MADGTGIEWTDATWNPVTGCSIVSKGCTNCYAMRLAGTRMKHEPSRAGLTRPSKAGPVWTGEVRFNEQWLDQPLRWRRPRRIFVCAHGDLFHEGVPGEWIDRIFAVMALSPQHTFQVLTKRPERMRSYCSGLKHRAVEIAQRAVWLGIWDDPDIAASDAAAIIDAGPLPNVWIGTSVEDQATADTRRGSLAWLAADGWTTFVSYEPALGPVDWTGWEFLKQIISGGESGPGARPSHPDWHRRARDFAVPRRIAFLFKQWGAWFPVGPVYQDLDDDRTEAIIDALAADDGRSEIISPDGSRWPECQPPDGSWVFRSVGKKAAGRLLDGREWNEFPEVRAT